MTCDDVRKRIKKFLEDLLEEDEYQDFIKHVNGCAACGDYTTALGSISNQLWKLGDVSVPSDFESTVLFKVRQLAQAPQAPKVYIRKKHVIAAVILILIGAAGFAAVSYFKKAGHVPSPAETPQVSTGATNEESPPDTYKKKSYVEEVKIIADSPKTAETSSNETVPAANPAAPAAPFLIGGSKFIESPLYQNKAQKTAAVNNTSAAETSSNETAVKH